MNTLLRRYYEGEDDVEMCFLCNEVSFITEMEKIEGEWYCGCNTEDEDTAELILKHKERLNKMKSNFYVATELHPLFQEICNTFKPK